jgi:hypothetical protein
VNAASAFLHPRTFILPQPAGGLDFVEALLALPKGKRLLSSEHFSVDGTLIDA